MLVSHLLGWRLAARLVLPAALLRRQLLQLLQALQRERLLQQRLLPRLRRAAQRKRLLLHRRVAPGPFVVPEGGLLRRLPLPILHVRLQGCRRPGTLAHAPQLQVCRPGDRAAAGGQGPLGQSLLVLRQRLMRQLDAGPMPLRHGIVLQS